MARRLFSLWLSLLVLVGALGVGLIDPEWLQQARFGVFDQLQRALPRKYEKMPIVIVDIDDESLAKIGQWPWPRDALAKLVTRLKKEGAQAIGFDIVFAEADRTSPSRLLAEKQADPAWRALLKGARDNDAEFARAIRDAKVVTGFVLTGKGAPPPEPKAGFAVAGDSPIEALKNYPAAVASLHGLSAMASGDGALNSLTDRDGLIRRMPLVFRSGENFLPSLTAEMLRVGQGAGSYTIKTIGGSGEAGENPGIVAVRIGELTIPTDREGNFWLHYTPYESSRYISAWKLLEEPGRMKELSGALVLIGTSAAGLKDIRATPMDPLAAGVEVHAQAMEQAIQGDFLSRPDWIQGAELIAMGLCGLLVILLMQRLPALWGAAVTLLLIAGGIGMALYAYAELHLLLDPVTPSLVILIVYLVESLRRYASTEREKQQIRHAFSHYMSPAMVEKLAADPGSLKLGGEIRDMSILFCDIRGFTAISERYDAEALTRFINRFLTPMTDIILAHRGTIDKYMGDCIMAFWNAPLDDPEHAAHAVQAALAMQEGLIRFNAEREEEARAEGAAFLPVEIGIGINSGPCCVGNMGSDQRFDYSVLGDDVNLASRLEGQSKEYGLRCVLGPRTRAQAMEAAVIELDLIRVKGKSGAVHIYGLLGDAALSAQGEFRRLASSIERMLACYRAQRWPEALTALEAIETITLPMGERMEVLVALYRTRIQAYQASPPPEGWDGVFTATSK